jgi:hypothetical protein
VLGYCQVFDGHKKGDFTRGMILFSRTRREWQPATTFFFPFGA